MSLIATRARRLPALLAVFFVRPFPAWALAVCGAVTLTLPTRTPAQQLSEGFAGSTEALPAGVDLALWTKRGLVTFDGSAVELLQNGQSQTLLPIPGAWTFGSFLLPTDPDHVLFGQLGIGPTGSNDAIWHIPLRGSAPAQPLAWVPFHYDAALLTPTKVLVSARTGGFSAPDNDLLVLDLATGKKQMVASVPGASGPVAVAANGDVFYATASTVFPVPPGSVTIVRFPRPLVDAALSGGTLLTLANAHVVMAGLDSAGDIVFDDHGDLLFADWSNYRVGEIHDANGQPTLAAPLLDYSGASVFPAALQFVPGHHDGVFEPFQPRDGRLLVLETDYFTICQLKAVDAARPQVVATGGSRIAAGPFDLVTSGGPGLGIGLVAFAFGAVPGQVELSLPGFGQPLWLSPALSNSPVFFTTSFDAAGSSVLTLTNPGSVIPAAATAQVLCVSWSGVLASSNAVEILLGP